MKAFKLFDENQLKRNEKIDEVMTTWLNENNEFKILTINQSIDKDGKLVILIYYSTCQPHSNT